MTLKKSFKEQNTEYIVKVSLAEYFAEQVLEWKELQI